MDTGAGEILSADPAGVGPFSHGNMGWGGGIPRGSSVAASPHFSFPTLSLNLMHSKGIYGL